jgi:hypothetical protein
VTPFSTVAFLLIFALVVGGCLASAPPEPTGRPYRLIVAGWNGQAVTLEPRPSAARCALEAGGRSARFWVTRAPARVKAAPTVLTARESELLDGVAVRCESGPSAARRVVRPLSKQEIAAGRVAIDGRAGAVYGHRQAGFRLDLRVEAFLPPPPSGS